MGIDSVGSVSGYSSAGSVSSAPSTSAPQPQTDNTDTPEVIAAQAAQADVPQAQTNIQPQTGDSGADAKSKEATDDQIKKAVAEINKKAVDSEAVFGIHEKTNRVTIKIVDKKTKDVIKEVPAEKTLDLIAKAWELAGLLVDEKR